MKIAIAVSGATLESQVDPRFGRCPYFLIIDIKTDKLGVIKNTAGQTFRGAGISAAQMIANKGVKAVIAGNFGPNAINVLNSSDIKIFSGIFGIKAKKALEQYKEGKLQETTVPIGAGGRRGLGMGRGMGRG